MRQLVHNKRPEPKHLMPNAELDVDQLFLKCLQDHYAETRPPFMQDWLDAIDELKEEETRRRLKAELEG